MSQSTSSAHVVVPAGLSSREIDVYVLAARGLSNAEIGAELFISEATVKTHMRSILRKAGVASRARLVAQAWGAPGPVDSSRRRLRSAVIGATAAAVVLGGTTTIAIALATPPSSPPDVVRAAADGGLPVRPFIAQVQPMDEVPRDSSVALDFIIKEGPDDPGTVVDSTFLGTRDVYFGVGALSSHDRVCLALSVIDPASTPDLPGRGVCTSFAEFTHRGLEIDMGAWSLRWYADGTVSWN